MKLLQKAWYGETPWLLPLWPLEKMFTWLARRRRARLLAQGPWQPPVPLVIVGNISVGGVGKTPLVIALVKALTEQGWKVGVVSRGYGGRAPRYPLSVTAESEAAESGDEPLLIATECQCPVMVDPDRVAACQALLQQTDVDVIISDDGLQHYRLGRHVEIAVIDAQRGLGNGHCFPVGPLREPPQRLAEVDFCILNRSQDSPHEIRGLPVSAEMHLQPEPLQGLLESAIPLSPPATVNAVAAIGNPERFFQTLETLGYSVIPHAFKDHHAFRAEDLRFANDYPVVMTAKDVVKCRKFAQSHHYYLPVSAQLPPSLYNALSERLRQSAPTAVD